MATFRIPRDWQDLDATSTVDDFEPTPNWLHQAIWRWRHPEQGRAQQALCRWKRRRRRSSNRLSVVAVAGGATPTTTTESER